MDETRFRALMRGAIGDEAMHPWLASAVRTRLAEAPRAAAPGRWAVLIAVAVVVLVTATAWFAPQFLGGRSTKVGVPAASPSPSPSPAPVAIDPSNCRLPVVLDSGQFGYIDTSTAGFEPAGGAGSTAVSYSPAVGRWLPVPYAQVSPDGRSYATAQGHELHVINISTSDDVKLLTFGVDVYVWRWDSSGIRVGEQAFEPYSRGRVTTWLVDPRSGASAEAVVIRSGAPFYPPGTPGHRWAFRFLGTDVDGHAIWFFHNQDLPEGFDDVFIQVAPNEFIIIVKDTYNSGFTPHNGFGDATGVWFLDSQHNAIWHWQQGGELVKVVTPMGLSIVDVAQIRGPCF